MDDLDPIPSSTEKLRREMIYKGTSKVKVPLKEVPYPRVKIIGELNSGAYRSTGRGGYWNPGRMAF